MGGYQPRTPHTPRTVTARALAVLGAFNANHPCLTQTQICRIVGLPPSTAYRLITELEAWGALVRDSDLSYRIGPKVRELASLSATRRPGEASRTP